MVEVNNFNSFTKQRYEKMVEEVKNCGCVYQEYNVNDIETTKKEYREHILKFVEKAKSKVYMMSGELMSFSDPEFRKRFKEILKQQQGKVEYYIIAGPNVIAEKNQDVNSFLKDFVGHEHIKFYLNKFIVTEQINRGYFHASVVDGGEFIHFENPHTYKTQPTEFYIVEECRKIGGAMIEYFERYARDFTELGDDAKRYRSMDVNLLKTYESNLYGAGDMYYESCLKGEINEFPELDDEFLGILSEEELVACLEKESENEFKVDY